MSRNRPYVLTIAGYDPSAGAGVLADIKTFENHEVYGLAIPTCVTHQTEEEFISIEWRDEDKVIGEIKNFISNYDIRAIKIGVVRSFSFLAKVIDVINKHDPEMLIVVDPVLKSTTKFTFIEQVNGLQWMKNISLITPNYEEITQLLEDDNAERCAVALSRHCHVLLKGGHNSNMPFVDQLYSAEQSINIAPQMKNLAEKHGSGCVLSSAIVAYLARGESMIQACIEAKRYCETFLSSNRTKLGYHVA